jgi:hypothetical protein
MEQTIVEEGVNVRMTVHRCPWHTAWSENDLLAWGRYYCLEIDEALVRGFNPALRLDVGATQTNDGEPCQFLFHDVEERFTRKGTVMPWGYHLGHLYSTMGDVIVEALGPTGQDVVKETLAWFAERYGEEAAQVVLAYWGFDFGCLPE